MIKKRYMIIAGAAMAAAVIAILSWWLFIYIPNHEVHIEEKIHLLKMNARPMRLKIVTRSNGTAKVAVKFFDLDNNNVGRCEQEYSGRDITLRITDVDICGRHIYFPCEMVQCGDGDTIRLPLKPYYTKDGFPMTYNSPNADPQLNHEIGLLYDRIQSGKLTDVAKMYHGTIKQTEITLTDPAELVNYTLTTSANGRMRISN